MGRPNEHEPVGDVRLRGRVRGVVYYLAASQRPVECEPLTIQNSGAFSASQTCVLLLKRLPLRLNLAIRHTRAKSGAANGFARFELQITLDMDYMFEGASAFDQDIGDWAVDSVRIMQSMFLGPR